MTDLLDTIAADLPDIDPAEIAAVMDEMDGDSHPESPDPQRYDRHHHNGFAVRGAVALFHSFRKAGRREEAAKIAETLLGLFAEHPDLQIGVPGPDIVLMRSYVKVPAKYARSERERLLDEIQAAADETDTDPSEEQRKAGNYRMGHVNVQGLAITIENPAGSTRRGISADGKPWSTDLANAYGYVRQVGASDADGDAPDCFMGPHPESEIVFVVDQDKPSGEFDEHKVLIGWTCADEAKAAYHANYSKGWKGFSAITPMTMPAFRAWLEHGDTSRPASHQAEETARRAYARSKPATSPVPFALDARTGLWHDAQGGQIPPLVAARYQRLAIEHGHERAVLIMEAMDQVAPRVRERTEARNAARDQQLADVQRATAQAQERAAEAIRAGDATAARFASDLASALQSRDREIAQARSEATAAVGRLEESLKQLAEKPAPEPIVARDQAVKYDRRGLISEVLVTDSAGRRVRKVMERGEKDGRVTRVRVEAA